MAQESHKSPNAIPPRTSSYGLNGLGIPQKSALRPLAETDWISSGKSSAKKHRHSQSSPPAMSPTPLSPRNLDAATHEKGLPWSAEKEKMILGPYEYLAGHPGKDFRAQMITAFNRLLRVPEASLAVITKVVGMLHTASLLIDDVEDSSNLRRGVPVANNIYGVPQTINSANYVYFLALQELQKLRSRKVIDIYTEELINLHRGQGLDLYWRDNLSCPTEAEYLDMVGNKTGGLFRLAIKLMQAEGTSAIDCLPIVNTMGLLFQVRDDHLNLSTYSSTKGLCEDLTEGKFSFPVIHAIQSDHSNNVLINILRQKTENEEVKKYAVSYMEKMGSFEHSRKTVNGLKEQALVMLEELEKQARDETGEQDRGSGIKIIIENLKVP